MKGYGRKWLALALAGLVLGTPATSLRLVAAGEHAPSGGFYGFSWGTTMAEVEAREGRPVAAEEGTLAYQMRLLGLNVAAVYRFVDDGLVGGTYKVLDDHLDRNQYVRDYARLKRALGSKYGPPGEDRVLWKDETYRGQPERRGLAVATGRLAYAAQWLTAESEIALDLRGGNFVISLTIEYRDRAFGEDAERREIEEKL